MSHHGARPQAIANGANVMHSAGDSHEPYR
jgi:hypothetical protein